MQLLIGVPRLLSLRTTVSGGAESGSVSTTNSVVFDLDGKSIEVSSGHQIVFEDGNTVAFVVETRKTGIFYARAYKNLTRGVAAPAQTLLLFIVGGIFMLFGIPAIFFFGLGLLPAALGVFLIREGLKGQEANRIVNGAQVLRSAEAATA